MGNMLMARHEEESATYLYRSWILVFCLISQTGGNAVRCNRAKYTEKNETPGALIYNVPGSRSGGIRTRGLLVPNSRMSLFFRLFPEITVNCRFFPLFAGFFRLFLEISKQF